MKKSVVLCGVATILIALLVPFVAAWYKTSPTSWPTDQFDKQKWLASEDVSRYRMYRDLVRSKQLNGLTRGDVRSMLGVPSSSSNDLKFDYYVIKHGVGENYSLNSIYLFAIEYDSNGRVIRHAVGAD